jgi:hypothetical protein
LQESVPAGDRIARFFEGRPGEASLLVLIRLACAACVWELVGVCAVLLATVWVNVLPREDLITSGYVFLAPPVYLFGLAFFTDWIGKRVFDPAGVSRLRVALSAAGALLLMLMFVAGAIWSARPTGWDHLGAVPYAGIMTDFAVVLACNMAYTNAPRRRYHKEWGRLPIELPS